MFHVPNDYERFEIFTKGMQMRNFIVYLYYAPECIRKWLAYIRPSYPSEATYTVEIKAENGQKAKNKAITFANKNFEGIKIINKNYHNKLWGINNYPELKERDNESTS